MVEPLRHLSFVHVPSVAAGFLPSAQHFSSSLSAVSDAWIIVVGRPNDVDCADTWLSWILAVGHLHHASEAAAPQAVDGVKVAHGFRVGSGIG